MANDVYVFGDSHWRVFFPFVNHGAATDNISHEQDGVRTIDTIANELSGSTMYGLLNPNSRHGARNRILSTIDVLGAVENVGLVFGEVDARYHYGRYFLNDQLSYGRVYELVSRYKRFIDEDLLMSGRVRKNVFVYHGFLYPRAEDTLQQPGQPVGDDGFRKAQLLNIIVSAIIQQIIPNERTHALAVPTPPPDWVSDDGVHLVPDKVYPHVLETMADVFRGQGR